MNGKDLLAGLNYIDRQYIEEAERADLRPKVRTWKRPMLIAALIAVMLMLVGCGVVYVMKMQDLKVDDTTETRAYFDQESRLYEFTEVPNEVLTLNGFRGSAAYQASQEWYAFHQEYDPDFAILESLGKNRPAFPGEYDGYYIYSEEMREKVDEIAGKYDMKLTGPRVKIQDKKAEICEGLGIDSLLRSDTPARMAFHSCTAYESGNFNLNFSMVMGEDQWPHAMLNTFYFLQKDVFDPVFLSVEPTPGLREWNYTTRGGSNVLILNPETNWQSFILCDRTDAVIVVAVESSYIVYSDDGNISETMEQKDLEQVADAIDFQIQPRVTLPND